MTAPYRTDEQLRAWIAQTRRNQRRLAIGLGLGAALALGARAADAFIGNTLIFSVIITGICGFWITSSHIADWRAQLAARRRDG